MEPISESCTITGGGSVVKGSGTPVGHGCDKWVHHEPSKYEGIMCKNNRKRDSKSKTQIQSRKREHELQVKSAMVAFKCPKIASDESISSYETGK